jgi:hypothetical protein
VAGEDVAIAFVDRIGFHELTRTRRGWVQIEHAAPAEARRLRA